jgi:MYXO-CTERM domain-containing protein
MEIQYYLRTRADQPEQRLLFASLPELEAGSAIDVWGASGAEGLRVDRFAAVPAPAHESKGQALIADQPLKPRKIAFVLVDLGGGVKLTKADAERKLFGTGPTDGSLRQYFIEASYGKQDIAGEVLGPIKATMTGCNFSALATSLRGSVPTGFDHYLWYFGTRVASCGFAGVAVTGTPTKPQRDTWYNAASDCVVLVQEPTHNFGALHSSSMKCRNGMPFADAPGNDMCVHNEYGDSYDPMGRACRHMNSYQKAFQGWFGGCNVVDVNSTGTFTLLPIELPCNGTQVLQIPMPKPRPYFHAGGGGPSSTTDLTHYYLEFRTPVGLDRGLTPQVQIRVSGDIRQRTQRGFNTWLLDMNPATAVQEGLIAGGTFTDPAGTIKITVMAIEAKQATVKVEVMGGAGGAPTCMDGKPLPAMGMGPESCSANIATPDGLPPPPIPTPDGGAGMGGMPTPGGSGGASGGAIDGALVPVSFDAGITEGFKDAGTSPGTEPIGTPLGGSSGNGSSGGSKGTGGKAGSGAGGSTGTAPAAASSEVATGGCSCRIDGGGREANGGGSALAGLVLFGLFVRRSRRRSAR